jgi:hypothetical protein
LFLAIASALFINGCTAQPLRKPVLYTGRFTAFSNSQLVGTIPGNPQAVYLNSLDITSNGNDWTAIIGLSNGAAPIALYSLKGTFGCANGLLETSLANPGEQCAQISGQNYGSVCLYFQQYCTGVTPYSTYLTFDNVYELQISSFCGVKGDVVLKCQGVCAGSVDCSPQVQQLVLEGGTSYVNDSTVIIQGGDTVIQYAGDTLTTQLSQNFTVNLMNTTEVTVNNDNSEVNFNVNQDSDIFLLAGPLRTCGGWLDFKGTSAQNVSINSAPSVLTVDTASVNTGDEGETWTAAGAYPTPLTFLYTSDLSGVGIQLEYCLQTAKVYGATQLGQVITLQLMNVTSGSPVQIESPAYAASALIYNHTNPAFISSVCGAIITDQINPGNTFRLYLHSVDTVGDSAPLIIDSGATYSLVAAPTGCVGNIQNITFNITFVFENGTTFDGDCPFDFQYDVVEKQFTLSTDGVTYIKAPAAGVFRGGQVILDNSNSVSFAEAGHTTEGCGGGTTTYEANVNIAPETCLSVGADGVENTGVCSISTPTVVRRDHSKEGWLEHLFEEKEVEPTVTQTGHVSLINSANIRPESQGGSILFRFTCPIDCGEDPIETDGKCNCGEGVETNGPVTSNDTCTCKEGVNTEGPVNAEGPISSPTCNCGETKTDTVSSNSGLPVNFPNGATFSPPMPVTIVFNPIPGASSSSGSSSGGSSSSSGPPSGSGPSPSSGSPSGSGIPSGTPSGVPGFPSGGGGCGGGGGFLQLDPKRPLYGIGPDGQIIEIIGSALSGAVSAAGGAASSAAGAASSAAGAAVSVGTAVVNAVTTVLCVGGGLPTPSGLGGIPNNGIPNLPGIPSTMLSASLAAAAAALTGPGISPIPLPPGAMDAAVAAIVAAATSGSIPSALPTEITIWTGGFDFPIVNNSLPHPDCNELYIGKAQILRGRPEGDILEVCVNRTEGGTEWFPVLFGDALFQAIYNGNGTGLIAGAGLELIAYPNGTLFEIRDAVSVTPGTCVNCIITFGPGGRAIAFASGETVISGNQTVWKDAIVRAENSALLLDNNCTFVNMGPTVLNDTIITSLNATVINVETLLVNGEPVGTSTVTAGTNIQVSAAGSDYTVSTVDTPTFTSLTVTNINGEAYFPTDVVAGNQINIVAVQKTFSVNVLASPSFNSITLGSAEATAYSSSYGTKSSPVTFSITGTGPTYSHTESLTAFRSVMLMGFDVDIATDEVVIIILQNPAITQDHVCRVDYVANIAPTLYLGFLVEVVSSDTGESRIRLSQQGPGVFTGAPGLMFTWSCELWG